MSDGRGVARVLFGICLVALIPRAGAASESPDTTAPVRTLHVLLTVSPDLPSHARLRLMSEASDLWDRAGVRLIWTAGSDGSIPRDRILRVLVIPRRSGVQESAERHVLGELLGFGRPGALAVASIDRAQQMVTKWRGSLIGPQSEHDGQLGLVLGRVVAHEIGHYLLGTATHSRTGLMRATFESPDLMDHRSPAYDLDTETAAQLRDWPLQAPFIPLTSVPPPASSAR